MEYWIQVNGYWIWNMDDTIIQLFYFVYFCDIITYRKEVRHEW